MAKKQPPIVETKFIKELHHTCSNARICTVQTQPNENCRDCTYYELKEVEVALEPARLNVDWGY